MLRSVANCCHSGKSPVSNHAAKKEKPGRSLLNFLRYSGVVQLVAHGPLEPRILVRVQAPEPFLAILRTFREASRVRKISKPNCLAAQLAPPGTLTRISNRLRRNTLLSRNQTERPGTAEFRAFSQSRRFFYALARFALSVAFISILRGNAAAETGAVTSSTPLRYSAVSLSASTPSGSRISRSNAPYASSL